MDHAKPGASRAATTASLLAAVVFAASLAGLTGCSRQPVEEAGIARVVLVEGQVSVRKDGASAQRAVVAGMRIEAGDRLAVQSGIVHVQYDATDEIQEVRAGTIVQINDPRPTRPAGST